MDAQWLKHPAKYHSEWVKIVRSWGEFDYCEDIVQETYLKLLKYSSEEKIVKDGEVNKGYVWFTLRSVFLSYIKQKGKIDKIRIGKGFEVELDEDFDNRYYSKVTEIIDKEVEGWHWYDKMLFDLYSKSNKSMRDIAHETNISLKSIFDTLKTCKNRLKERVGEDWEDYKNGDYELI